MAATSFAISVSVMTVFWGLIGGVIPWFIPKGPNRAYLIHHTFVKHYLHLFVSLLY